MKTDAGKYLMRIERTQDYLENIEKNNEAAKWETMEGNAITAIIKWAEENGYDPMVELFYKGRQCGRVAMARQALDVLGRRDKGGEDDG